MITNKFFISHYSGDKNIAELFSNALRRITLEQITLWYSSDSGRDNGLKPGDIWFNQILKKIISSRAVVSLLTPNSINRPWIYFESGIGQALDDCPVIPVCIGVKRDSILPPLGLYQCYQLNNYNSVVEFFSKLLDLFQIKFDEEMSKVVIKKFITDISKITFEVHTESIEQIQSIEKLLENFKGHIDMRFIELIDKTNYSIVGDYTYNKDSHKSVKDQKYPKRFYSVTFSVNFPEFKNDLFIDISENESFQDVANNLYFILRDYVGVYKYLEDGLLLKKHLRNVSLLGKLAVGYLQI
ncbi:MAG: toll/interleukin-1 receptor domain-containing protein [Saprospiraceae bacterium]|nr:toll/interleukin-1 receptor domain-containing protein [Saprospiraceae bacterium]